MCDKLSSWYQVDTQNYGVFYVLWSDAQVGDFTLPSALNSGNQWAWKFCVWRQRKDLDRWCRVWVSDRSVDEDWSMQKYGDLSVGGISEGFSTSIVRVRVVQKLPENGGRKLFRKFSNYLLFLNLDFRLSPRCWWHLRSSGVLRVVVW